VRRRDGVSEETRVCRNRHDEVKCGKMLVRVVGGGGVGSDWRHDEPVHLLVESTVGPGSRAHVLRQALPAQLSGVAQSLVACDGAQRQLPARLGTLPPWRVRQLGGRDATWHSAATQTGPLMAQGRDATPMIHVWPMSEVMPFSQKLRLLLWGITWG
jgi:hypothetical protein